MRTMPPEAAPRTGFDEFYRRRWPDAARWATALTGRPAVGQELAQEAFINLRARYDSLANPVGYLRRTVVNLSRAWHRSSSREDARMAAVAKPDVVASQSSELGRAGALPFHQRHPRSVVLGGLTDADIATVLQSGRHRPVAARRGPPPCARRSNHEDPPTRS
jgi:DNA-directed RNA polymerase specialized sigma24 family protein